MWKKKQFLIYLFSISNARKRVIKFIFVCEKKRQFLIYLFSISNARKRPINTILVSEKKHWIFVFYYFCFIKNLTTDKPKIAFFFTNKNDNYYSFSCNRNCQTDKPNIWLFFHDKVSNYHIFSHIKIEYADNQKNVLFYLMQY